MAAAGFQSIPRPKQVNGLMGVEPDGDGEGAPKKKKKWLGPPAIASVCLGAHHTLMLSQDGNVYSCGRGDSGQLGHGDLEHCFEPRKVQDLDTGDRVRMLAASANRSAAVSERDNFFIWGKSWGTGYGGVAQTVGGGRRSKEKPVGAHTPRIVPALTKRCIVSLKLGSEHGVAADNIGNVYTFGASNSHLQLGTQTPWHGEERPRGSDSAGDTPLQIRVAATVVSEVACGFDHCISMTKEDEGYVWGSNVYGQLGLGHRRPEQRPTLLREFKGSLIKQIHSGGDYNAVLTDSGELYTWGRNLFGQLGLGQRRKDDSVPRPVPCALPSGAGKIRTLACGSHHVLCLCEGNRVYAWGRGVHGQLGNGFITKQSKPTLITNLMDFKAGTEGAIVAVACGDNHSAVVTDKGCVFTWGSDLYGQLGLGRRGRGNGAAADAKGAHAESATPARRGSEANEDDDASPRSPSEASSSRRSSRAGLRGGQSMPSVHTHLKDGRGGGGAKAGRRGGSPDRSRRSFPRVKVDTKLHGPRGRPLTDEQRAARHEMALHPTHGRRSSTKRAGAGRRKLSSMRTADLEANQDFLSAMSNTSLSLSRRQTTRDFIDTLVVQNDSTNRRTFDDKGKRVFAEGEASASLPLPAV